MIQEGDETLLVEWAFGLAAAGEVAALAPSELACGRQATVPAETSEDLAFQVVL